MSKVAIISDTHFGIRNDSTIFIDNTKKFLDNIFFPKIKELGIEYIIHSGDLVDRRKFINFNTSKRMREDFLLPIKNMGLKLDVIIGNHDIYYKNINEVNALSELIEDRFDNVNLYYNSCDVNVLGTNILYVPWILDQNKKQSLESINNTESQICIGHLEIAGFSMYRGSPESDGMSSDVFNKFDMVITGHFHHRSSKNNIHYVGSHSEFFWSDWNDPRGFHILDLNKRELEFIPNTYTIYEKFYYNNTDIKSLKQEFFKNKILKIIIKNKESEFEFDKFIEKVESFSPIDYQIIDDIVDIEENQQDNIEIESTIDICKKYIENIDSKNVDKKELENKLIEIYNEAVDKE